MTKHVKLIYIHIFVLHFTQFISFSSNTIIIITIIICHNKKDIVKSGSICLSRKYNTSYRLSLYATFPLHQFVLIPLSLAFSRPTLFCFYSVLGKPKFIPKRACPIFNKYNVVALHQPQTTNLSLGELYKKIPGSRWNKSHL